MDKDGISLEVTIPGNSTATVEIPALGGDEVRVRENGTNIWTNGNRTRPNHAGIESVSRDDDRIVVELSAGEYAFELDHLGES